jgi:hypothetical protein
MKRATTVAVALALGAIVFGPGSAASAAGPAGLTASIAAADCTREKAKVGKRAFRKHFGERRPMVRCIAATAPAARRAITVATNACQAELDEWGLEEFEVEWESFSVCVSVYADWEMDGGLADDTEGAGDIEDADED